ncbi:MAG: AAA family ATPase [Zoogloeaceae bacterium]|nr:AAA family ATPase [Zoogloeaceae bacterium]
MRSLLSIKATNFLSLNSVDVQLQELSVLVGPNGVGKSNLLKVIQFLGDVARLDLVPAIRAHGGFDRLLFRGVEENARIPRIGIGITGLITGFSSERAPDEYDLSFWQHGIRTEGGMEYTILRRREDFAFKRTQGRGRRITVSGSKVEVTSNTQSTNQATAKRLSLAESSSGLSTLPRLGKNSGGEQINQLAQLFTTFRVFDIDTTKARAPSRHDMSKPITLDRDAGNLAAFLRWLQSSHDDIFDLLEEDLRVIVPSLKKLEFIQIGGSDDSTFALQLVERGLRGPTNLSEASFGTIRTLALLAMLHDPKPPRLTCVEEIDHGLHPHALDRIVERMRSASRRTQLLVVTHSPALANRLKPKEIVVCERDYDTGASTIPAISSAKVEAMAKASGLLPGELWFSGALGAMPRSLLNRDR